MKNYLLLLLFSLSLFSCAIPKMGHPVSGKGVAYVKKENGNILHPQTIKVKAKKIVADGEKILMTQVQAYCDGRDSFLRVGKIFAAKYLRGDINVYTNTSTYTTTSYTSPSPGMPGGVKASSHSRTKIYLQGPGSPALMLMNYKSVKSLLSVDEAAYKYVLKYEHARRTNRIWAYSSLGVIVTGAVMALAFDPRDSKAGIGVVTMFGGVVSGAACLGTRSLTMHLNLFKAISKHNGMMKD